MINIKKSYICLIPIGIYFSFFLIMQIKFGHSLFFKSLVVSIFANCLYALLFFMIKRSGEEAKSEVNIVVRATLVLAICLVFLVFICNDDSDTILIGGTAIHSILAFISLMYSTRKMNGGKVIKDSKTGQLIRVRNGQYTPLTSEDRSGYIAPCENAQTAGSSIVSASGVSCSSPLSPSGSGYPSTQTCINPSSGLPRTGGMSGLDVAGNSWGTNFNDPTSNNTYDPNRGC